MTHNSNHSIFGAILSMSTALVSISNFVPVVQLCAGLVAIASGIYSFVGKKKK